MLPLKRSHFIYFYPFLVSLFSISSLYSTCRSSDFPRECVLIRAKFRQNAGATSGGGAPISHTGYSIHNASEEDRREGVEGNGKLKGTEMHKGSETQDLLHYQFWTDFNCAIITHTTAYNIRSFLICRISD